MEKLQSNGSGISFVGVLAIVLIVLKLCGVISWSWWWVTAPLWIPAAIALVVIIFCIIAAVIQEVKKK